MFKLMKSKGDKSINHCRLVFNCILQNEPVSRSSLLEITGMKMSTLVRAMNWLEQADLIIPSETGESIGGRKPALYSINPNSGLIIGVDLSRAYSRVALLDLGCNIIKSSVFGMYEDSTPEVVLEKISNLISEFTSGMNKEDLLGICVGTVGPIDKEQGIILHPANFPSKGWKNVSIKKVLEEKTGLITFVEDGTTAAALGEYRKGYGKSFKNIAYIIAGVGLRLGIIIDGKPIKSININEGNFGHTPIDSNGKPCTCGNKGCLEAYVSIGSILQDFKIQIKSGNHTSAIEKVDFDLSAINFDVFSQAVQTEDQLANEIIQKVAGYFSLGIVGVMNIMNPDLILLGGPMIKKCNKLFELSTQMALDKSRRFTNSDVKFSTGILEENAVIIGAANIVLDYYLQ